MPNGLRRGGRRNRNARLQTRVPSAARREHRANFSGLVLRGTADPHRVNVTPWNQAVVSTTLVGATNPTNVCITINDICVAFKNQMGLAKDLGFSVRLIRNQSWHLTPNGELNNVVRCRYYSLINTQAACNNYNVLAQLEDYGTTSRPAHVSYVWPRTHSSNIFASSEVLTTMRYTLQASQQVLMHTHIMWRFSGVGTTQMCALTKEISIEPHSYLFNASDSLVDDFDELTLGG